MESEGQDYGRIRELSVFCVGRHLGHLVPLLSWPHFYVTPPHCVTGIRKKRETATQVNAGSKCMTHILESVSDPDAEEIEHQLALVVSCEV